MTRSCKFCQQQTALPCWNAWHAFSCPTFQRFSEDDIDEDQFEDEEDSP
jgi:hypothetical protein